MLLYVVAQILECLSGGTETFLQYIILAEGRIPLKGAEGLAAEAANGNTDAISEAAYAALTISMHRTRGCGTMHVFGIFEDAALHVSSEPRTYGAVNESLLGRYILRRYGCHKFLPAIADEVQ